MRPRLIMMIALTVLLLISSLSIVVSGSEAAQDGEESSFLGDISGNVVFGIDAVTDAVSKRADNTVLPGVAPISEGVVNVIEHVGPTVSPIESPYTFTSDPAGEVYIKSGAEITVANDVTVTATRLYIDSAGTPIPFSTGDRAKIVIQSLVIEDILIPLPEMAVQAKNASITSTYQVDGNERTFTMGVAYDIDGYVAVTIGDSTVKYSSDTAENIVITITVDTTGYTGHVTAPGTFSSVDKLIRYIGSLDLIKTDVKIDIGGTYGSDDYPTPFHVTDMSLHIDSHKDDAAPYYSIDLSIGNVSVYPVNNSGMHIFMELPASRMADGSRSSMDRSKAFTLTADSIKVKRVEPDDPLSVNVSDLDIEMISAPDQSLSFDMGQMVYSETVSDAKGSYEQSTTVTDFSMNAPGATAEILDDVKSFIKEAITSESAGATVSFGKIEYSKTDADTGTDVVKSTFKGIKLTAALKFPTISARVEMGSFEYTDASGNISSSSVGYEVWAGVDLSAIPDKITLKGLLGMLRFGSVAVTTVTSEGDYIFTLDKAKLFLAKYSTDGLKAICGDDSVTFSKDALKTLSSVDDNKIGYKRLTSDEISEKVPEKARQRLNGGAVIEIYCSSDAKELEGQVEVKVKTDLNSKSAGAYGINGSKLEKKDFTAEDGIVSFKTDSMGMYAVSGPLTNMGMATVATIVLVSMMALGAVTVIVGRRLLLK